MINGLKKEKICRFYAETLLKTTIKVRNLILFKPIYE